MLIKTFKILGLLLTYPEGTLLEASDQLLETLHDEGLLSKKSIKYIMKFLDDQKSKDLMAVQEEYVETFDRGRAHCLHLFEHIHGESRDRGQAMVDLSETYAKKGFLINSAELPDYLPLFLEYLSMCSLKEATDLLGEAIDIISVIGSKLKKRKSIYNIIFKEIENLSFIKPDKIKVSEAVKKAPKDPETFDELDKEWHEAEAFSKEGISSDCRTCPSFSKTTNTLEKMLGEAQ